VIQTSTWTICLRKDSTIRIGCKDHTVDEWLGFDEATIASMDPKAVDFMAVWKPVIMAIVKP